MNKNNNRTSFPKQSQQILNNYVLSAQDYFLVTIFFHESLMSSNSVSLHTQQLITAFFNLRIITSQC